MEAHYLKTEEKISVEDLRAEGIHFQTLTTEPSEYQGALDELKDRMGYIEQDQISLSPDTPNLDELENKFIDEHLHLEDEVRFVLSGAGIFDIRTNDDRWMRITVHPGDLIVVPENRHHRFMLTDEKSIQCVRLFRDKSGWVPHYRSA